MNQVFWTPLTHAAMITAFVAVMMMAVEYLSVVTRGAFQRALMHSRWTQYVAAVLLGAVPGCLGSFTVVTLYAHRVLPLGAVVGAMIATSGDEAFVMFALFPAKALWLTLGLAALGLAVAPLVDLLAGRRPAAEPCPNLVVHDEDLCHCFPGWLILEQWRRPSPVRVALTAAMIAFVALVAAGVVGAGEWNWIRVTLLLVGSFGAFVVGTVPDHFLQKHLWEHVARKHVPRVFAWTFGVLLVVAALGQLAPLESIVRESQWGVLAFAGLAGLVPESGPHLIFVTLFSDGQIPASILIANSIVQDGHGMLPLLADSRKDFLRIKAVNLGVGLVVGAALLAIGH